MNTKPLHLLSDDVLEMIAANDADDRQDDAIDELDRRADFVPPDDTPSLDAPWWAQA